MAKQVHIHNLKSDSEKSITVHFTILSEMAFLTYVSNFGYINMIGHYFKILSFYMMYKAIIETSIIKPYLIIFKELKDKEAELTRLTMTDALTGLFNRRAAFEFLEQAVKSAFKSKSPLVVCFLDLDELKSINDQLGHAAGDYMIQKLAALLSDKAKPGSRVCRVGGDEFMIIFQDSTTAEVERNMADITGQAQIPRLYENNRFNMNFSYGLSEYDGHTPPLIDILIQEADQNMYRHKMKKKGRTPRETGI